MNVTEKLEYDLIRLEKRHTMLDTNIARGYTNYLDDVNLHKMKQEKAIVKRQIEETRHRLRNR